MAEKILVVDDDLDSLKLIGLMLQRNGYEVIAANAGSQALARALSDHPDLIILDVMMPDMNGYEVSRRLRKNPTTQNIPIIMFTAKTLIDDKVAGFEAGADDYLTKPTHPAELASRVKAILDAQCRSAPNRFGSARADNWLDRHERWRWYNYAGVKHRHRTSIDFGKPDCRRFPAGQWQHGLVAGHGALGGYGKHPRQAN